MKARMFPKAGFTLVELMIVVAIIGLLAVIAIPSFVHARDLSRERACVNNLRQIDGAKDEYALEGGLSTGDACAIGDIMPYVRRTEPTCPVGNTPYTINVIGTTPECASSAAALHNAAYNN